MPVSNSGTDPVSVARNALKNYLEVGSLQKLPIILPPEYPVKAGVFVSLKIKGHLRGCIGTIQPTRETLVEEIAKNAVSAAMHDPRFPPLSHEEFSGLSISVDILGPLEEVKDETGLDPKKYGVLVRSGPRSGLLLPDLEGVDTVEQQISIARQKAGISSGEQIKLYRFTVTRYGEK
ncbi:MAG: AmmeMemoRadiSam system protein A [Dethiobacteria bacterium]|nr:AmmeMemoRadiSam system protein A [Dethiobacteria bacterium]